METEFSEKFSENDYYLKKIAELKTFNYHNPDHYQVGKFIDIMDDAKNWCVGQITDRSGDTMTVHYEGCNSKSDEMILLKRTIKFNQFRKFSRGYSGFKRCADRNYIFNIEDVKEIEREIKNLKLTKFSEVNDPLEFTQLFRGKIFTYIDIFMTTAINTKDQTNQIAAIHNLLCEYISMTYEYFIFYKENLHVVNNYLMKHKDLYLVDTKCAILASIYEVIVTLRRILGEDTRVSEFYKTNEEVIKKLYKQGNGSSNIVLPCANVKTKICIDKAYKSNSEYNKLPAIIIASMIDYFYERNVFSAIWAILLNNQSNNLVTTYSLQQPQAHFDTFEVILGFLHLFRIIIDKTIFAEENSQFKPYFTSRIMNITEMEIKEVRRGIIVNAIRYSSFLIPSDLKLQKFFFEELYLTYYYKCLTSKNLEKRIAGITAINLIIDTIERKEVTRVDAYSYHSNGNKIELDENIEITDSKGLISFFREKNFLEALLGENIHEEIIKRAISFFRILAKKNSNLLNDIVYDLMWKNYEEKHESIAIQIENIICELSFYISDKDKLYLFNKLKLYAEKMSIANFSNPFSSDSNFFAVTRKIINFIRNFTENCLKKNSFTLINSVDLNDEKVYGLPLLWNFMQDETLQIDSSSNQMLTDNINSPQNISQIVEIIEMSSESIFNLFNLNNIDLDTLKEKVLTKCFDNIKSNKSVVQSTNLIRKIIQQLPNYITKKFVKTIDEQYSIINLIVNNLERYLTKTKEITNVKIDDDNMSTNSNINPNSNSFNITYEGYYTHKTNIEARLDLIYFFSNESRDRGKLILSSDCILKLWNIFVIDSNNEMEKNFFIESMCRNSENFDNLISEFIFGKILLNKQLFDFSKINPTSFAFFEKVFYAVNIYNKKIVHDGKSYRIQLEDIIGLDSIYEIICEVENITVRNKFAKLLSQLFTDFKIYNEEMCNRFWKKGIDRILQILEENFNSKNEVALKGIISFIKYLIEEFGNAGEIPKQDDVSFPREGLEYTFIYPEKNESRTIRVAKNEFTGDVRYRVAFFFDIPINSLKLKTKQKLIELNDDFKLFVDICPFNSPVEIKEGIHPILNLKNNPKNLLMCDSKLNKILYDLLHNSNAGYIQDVWELINILPKNVELEEGILQIGKKDFNQETSNISMKQYFDDQSIYVMSYSLKMIKSIIFYKSEASENKKDSINREWMQNFSNNNGLTHLIKLIFQFKIEHFSSELGFECLIDLLYILKHFQEVTNCFENDSDSFIQKVFQIIHLIILSSIEKDKDIKLKEIQESFRKRKEREFFRNQTGNENFNMTTTNNFYELNRESDEEVCEEILKIFNNEDESIRNLLGFIDDMASHIKDSKSVYKNLLNSIALKEIVTIGLIIPQNYKFKITLKKFFKNLLDLLSFEEEELAKIFKTTLFEFMLNKETLSLANQHVETCGYFFKILTAMLEEYLDPSTIATGKNGLDINSLTEFLIDYIINKESSEENTEENDNVLEGYLLILRVLIIKSRELSEIVNKNYNIIDLILNKCLLLKCQEKSTSAPFPKCTTPSSRESAYKLLAALSYNNPEITLQITNVLNNYHMLGYWKSKRLFDWKISLANDEKSSTGYVGLKNLGCTCYMNSLIQQFFMIPELRESLLASPDSNIADTNKPECSSLYQIKNIFASLKAYDGQYYNAKDFCLNFDGTVLDIKEQMDVDEFYNTLIDKLENHTKGTPFQNIFKHLFGFTISDEFICKGCPHYSEREQYFNSIQLQVVNKKSLTESLKSYIEGELLEGDNAYYCEKCDKKVNTLKRQCIKKLPRILIIVLKRFEFDYENMMKIKVNDYLEFPHELNMEPYTQEYLEKIEKINKNENNSMGNSSNINQNVEMNEEMPGDGDNIDNNMDDENSNIKEKSSIKISEKAKIITKPSNYHKYNLSGVVIHSGTSENGHYYSIIKDYLKNNWYEFNDTNVKDYDLNDLNSEAFGGTEVIFKDNKKETVEKTTNAYLLFYKRQFEEKEEEGNGKQEEEKTQQVEKIESEGKNHDNNSIVSERNPDINVSKQIVINQSDKFSNISPTIMDRIDLDNFQYWVSKIIFTTEYHSFITDLLVNSNLCDIAVYNYPTKNDNKELFIHLNLLRMNNKSITNDKIEIELQEIKEDKSNNNHKSFISKIKNLNIDPNIVVNPSNYHKNDFVIVANQEYEFTLFKFACLFFLNVLIRARDKNYLPSIIDWLKAMINKNNIYANWLLEEFSNYEIITEYLVDPPIGDIKKLIVGLLYCAMISSYKSFSTTNTLADSIESNQSLVAFIGNIIAYMLKNSEKDLSSVYNIIYRFSILGEQSKLFLINSGCLHLLAYFYVNKSTSAYSNSNICFSKPIDAISFIKIKEYFTPSHKELDQKLMNRIEKLSAWEELTEKKLTDKFSQRNEQYLLMIFSELVTYTNLNTRNILGSIVNSNIKLDLDLLQVLRFDNTDLIRCLLLEIKTKQAASSLFKLFMSLCINNMENTSAIQQVLLDLIGSMDSVEFDYILIIFKKFMLDIEDSFKDARIRTSLVKYSQVILENTRYWSYMDASIDFLIKLFLGNMDILKNYVESIKDSFVKLLKYLKDNPCPPTMIPSKTQTMYKRRQVMLPNKISQFQINAFNTKYTNLASDKINRLREIYSSNNKFYLIII